MLVSVTERTREIGLRKAVGARRGDILRQFLTEATTLALMGGIAGIALGVGAAAAIANFAGWPTLIRLDSMVLGVTFSAAVGVFFGFYPARKAAALALPELAWTSFATVLSAATARSMKSIPRF